MRRTGFVVPLLLWTLIVAAYLRGHMGCSDSRWSVFATASLIDSHNLNLDEFESVIRERGFYFTEHIGPHYYNFYPIGASLVAVPFVVVLRPVAAVAFRWFPGLRSSMEAAQWQRGCPPARGEPLLILHSWTEQIIASSLVAFTALLLYAMARRELSTINAAVFVLVFAFGTSAWSTASRSLWQHGPSMLMLAAALLVLNRGSRLMLAGMALAFAYVIRPTNAIPLALLSLWVGWMFPRRLSGYLAGVAIVLGPFLVVNRYIYGSWLSPYYHPSSFHGNPFFGDALAGLVVSPGRGLFVYSPVLLFAFVGVALKVRQHRLTTLDGALIACIAFHWVSSAWVNPDWWGGDSYGPRFFADMLPFLMYLTIPVLGVIEQAYGASRASLATMSGIAAGVSVLMHAQGVFNPKAMEWNREPTALNLDPNRLWDWRHPPFLAGFVPGLAPAMPPDLSAVPCDAPPGPPTNLMIVSNRNNAVTASWVAATGAVGVYAVESGNGSGLSDLPTRETPATTLTVARIPPGTYYARVRARNSCGISPPSNEVTLVVK